MSKHEIKHFKSIKHQISYVFNDFLSGANVYNKSEQKYYKYKFNLFLSSFFLASEISPLLPAAAPVAAAAGLPSNFFNCLQAFMAVAGGFGVTSLSWMGLPVT